MSSKTVYECDIEDCTSDDVKNTLIPIIRTTETTQGLAVEPYLVIEHIDICDFHKRQIVRQAVIPTAARAQGFDIIRLPGLING